MNEEETELYKRFIDFFPNREIPKFVEIMDYALRLREIFNYSISSFSCFTPVMYRYCLVRQGDGIENEEINNEITFVQDMVQSIFPQATVYPVSNQESHLTYIFIDIRFK